MTLNGRGDATQGDDLLTSAFAHQTHRIRKGQPMAQRSAVRPTAGQGTLSAIGS